MEASTSRMISLTGLNYQAWKRKMKDLLYVKDYYQPVFQEAKPKGKSEDEWKIAHLQACGFIHQFIDDNILNHIMDVEDARLLW